MASNPFNQQDESSTNRQWRRSTASYGESTPLIQPSPLSTTGIGALCTCGIVTVLAVSWCVLDFWNHKLSNDLFTIGHIRAVDTSTGAVTAPFQQFSYPLTLAFVQFLFMGAIFFCVHWALTQQPTDLRQLLSRDITSDKRWPSLVISHVFSTFWLQSLMMPSQMMYLGLYASSRAVEIPVAAALRAPVLGARVGKKTMQTTGLAFVAACTLYYAYAELAGCVCIMSGNGVALTGAAFWIIYALVLAMPAVNAVCQEGLLTQASVHPLQLLAVQNMFAAILFTPILIFSYLLGWEDVGAAFNMMLSNGSVLMLVVWLCAQLTLTSVVCIMTIIALDSFWTVSLRALRVIFWAMAALTHFYMQGPGVALSIASPRTSFWSFVICCGAGLAGAAIYTDRKAEDELSDDKHPGGNIGEKA